MNLKVYERTRYQNIYRHKKNGNYVVAISNPKTSISRMPNGDKIWNKDDALKIRDNKENKLTKQSQLSSKVSFSDAWGKYIDWCKNEQKQEYNTYYKKEKLHNAHLVKLDKKIVSRLTKEEIKKVIDNLNTTDKQKNEILQKTLKPFFNWCKDEENLILINPIENIKLAKVEKPKIDYWTTDEIRKFFDFVNNYIKSDTIPIKRKEIAYRVKIYASITFSLGDRLGETRSLFFDSFNSTKEVAKLFNSIEYNPDSNSFVKDTKTPDSVREVNVSKRLISEVQEYKEFLINELGYPVKDDSLIFFNYNSHKPFSDNTLRNNFYMISEMAGVSKIIPYALRHTFVAVMMKEGRPLYQISPYIGHKKFSTTVDRYGHLERSIRKEIAESTDKYF